ncbi:hypothetical protein [Azonexus sp. IMCC34839]|uniref:hypothetical protein n=1 Tax=Azonexus sp. IMCC34839 TaxID=3133695 RepID=UPI00399C3515
MAFADNLPISESIGVFVGISGFDWLTEGRAEPLSAAVAAIGAGTVIYLARYWLRKRKPPKP